MSVDTENLLDLPLEVRAGMARKEAVENVIEEHIRLNLPIYIWRDGQVVDILPEKLKERAALKSRI